MAKAYIAVRPRGDVAIIAWSDQLVRVVGMNEVEHRSAGGVRWVEPDDLANVRADRLDVPLEVGRADGEGGKVTPRRGGIATDA